MELNNASVIDQTEYGKSFFKELKTLLEVLEKDLDENMRVNTTEVAEDFRYKTGVIHGIKKVLGLPDRLRAARQNREKSK